MGQGPQCFLLQRFSEDSNARLVKGAAFCLITLASLTSFAPFAFFTRANNLKMLLNGNLMGIGGNLSLITFKHIPAEPANGGSH